MGKVYIEIARRDITRCGNTIQEAMRWGTRLPTHPKVHLLLKIRILSTDKEI